VISSGDTDILVLILGLITEGKIDYFMTMGTAATEEVATFRARGRAKDCSYWISCLY
jgi:hypothetical protein